MSQDTDTRRSAIDERPGARLPGRVAVVTGGARGIGAGIARLFARHGAEVVVADQDLAGARATVAQIQTSAGSGIAARVDVTDSASARGLIDWAIEQLERIDILVNVAGIGSFAHFNDVSDDDFDRVMQVNVYGTFYCSQAAARHMVHRKYGRIINIASIAGVRAGEHRLSYGTSKAAVIGLTRQGARDLAPFGITVNAVGPGPVDTELTRTLHTDQTRNNYLKVIPAGRYGTIEEIADAALFLAGDAAGYVNGHILYVDGGYVSAGVAEATMI